MCRCRLFPPLFFLVLLLAIVFAPAGCRAAVRTYFIAVDELTWDYAPTGVDGMTGVPFNASAGTPDPMTTTTTTGNGMSMAMMNAGAAAYVLSGPRAIGRVYKKALYREYTDGSFTTLKARAPEWLHLGLLGPLIRAQVGDTISVTFKNQGSMNSYSMHPHGVFYTKANEGVPSGAMSTAMDGNSVAPGATYVYTWLVPERAGPGPRDGSSVLWVYHSHVDEVADTNAGLIGPIVVTAAGAATSNAELRPLDVSREFVLSFTIMDENSSPYLNDSIAAAIRPPIANDSMWLDLVNDPAFMQSNLKHAVNGYLYSNVPGLNMTVNERVRWYVFSLGSETDIHGAHWHGNTLLHVGQRLDVMELIPASLRTLDMVPDDAGTWMIHCHTNMHIKAGMMGLYSVAPCSSSYCPSTPPSLSEAGSCRDLASLTAILLLAMALVAV